MGAPLLRPSVGPKYAAARLEGLREEWEHALPHDFDDDNLENLANRLVDDLDELRGRPDASDFVNAVDTPEISIHQADFEGDATELQAMLDAIEDVSTLSGPPTLTREQDGRGGFVVDTGMQGWERDELLQSHTKKTHRGPRAGSEDWGVPARGVQEGVDTFVTEDGWEVVPTEDHAMSVVRDVDIEAWREQFGARPDGECHRRERGPPPRRARPLGADPRQA